MTKEEKALRDQIRVAVPNPVMRRSVLLKVGKALRAAREDVLQVARDCHHHHRCDSLNPCELCRLMNPNWKPTTIRGKK